MLILHLTIKLIPALQIDLQPGELKINGGKALYKAPGGKKFNGTLIITNKRLLYDAVFNIDAKGVLPDIMFIRWGSLGYIEIDKTDIIRIDKPGWLSGNKVTLTLGDGSKHVFNSGVLGKNIAKAIRGAFPEPLNQQQ